jgi:hypothetical protein
MNTEWSVTKIDIRSWRLVRDHVEQHGGFRQGVEALGMQYMLDGLDLDAALTKAYQQAFDAMLRDGFWIDPSRGRRWNLRLTLRPQHKAHAICAVRVVSDQTR